MNSDSGSIGHAKGWMSSCKRPVLASVVILMTLGSVALYARFIRTLPPLPASRSLLDDATGQFDVEITLTFDAHADSAFVLEPTSVLVQLAGVDLLHSSQSFEAGQPVVIDNVSDIKVGDNVFWIQVHAGDPADTSQDAFSLGVDQRAQKTAIAVARAVRVRVYRDAVAIADATLWSEPGEPVLGEVSVDVPQDGRSDDHSH